MTLATAINKVQALGDGSTVAFSFPHLFFVDSDLQVHLTVIATEVSTLQVLTTNYTVSGAGNPSGGTVTFITAPPTTVRVTIKRIVAKTQGTDYQNASSFDQEVLEKDQDLAIMSIQRMQEELDRAPQQDVGTVAARLTMPEPETGKSIGWNSSGALANQSSLPVATFAASPGDALKPVRVNSAENGLEAHPGLSRPSKAVNATTVLTDSDEHYIVVSGLAANINLTLPGTANVKRGDERIVINLDATFSVVILADNIVVILTLPPNRNVTLMATQDAPTTPSHWAIPITALATLSVDTIAELTAAAGVTIDSVLLKDNGIQTDSGGTNELTRTRIIEIGDWNMDVTVAVNVAHGLTLAKIRGITVIIRADSDTVRHDFPKPIGVAATEGSEANVNNIVLIRATGGFFDTTTYDSTSFNRGWVIITHVV